MSMAHTHALSSFLRAMTSCCVILPKSLKCYLWSIFVYNGKRELKAIFRGVPNQVQVSPVLSVVYAVKILNIILQGILFNPPYRGLDERYSISLDESGKAS